MIDSNIKVYDFYNKKEINPNMIGTLTSGCCRMGSGTFLIKFIGGGTPMNENVRIRKLTPKECFRLMGFNDSDYEAASKVNSDSQLYKQAGNSIVVAVLEAIFREML